MAARAMTAPLVPLFVICYAKRYLLFSLFYSTTSRVQDTSIFLDFAPGQVFTKPSHIEEYNDRECGRARQATIPVSDTG